MDGSYMESEQCTHEATEIFRRQKMAAVTLSRQAYRRRLADSVREFGPLSELQIALLRSTVSAAEADLARFNDEYPPS